MIDLYYMINPYNKIYLPLIDPGIYHKFYLAKGIIGTEKFAVAVYLRCFYASSKVMIETFKSTKFFTVQFTNEDFLQLRKIFTFIPPSVHLLYLHSKER